MSRGLRKSRHDAREATKSRLIAKAPATGSRMPLPLILATGAATVYVLSNPGGFYSLYVSILRNCVKLIRPLPMIFRVAQNLI